MVVDCAGVRAAWVGEVPAPEVRPGDYLPPQAALHGTRWQETGFQVGPGGRDVRTDLPVASGTVLLFDRAGALRPIDRGNAVTVRRVAASSRPE
jgi:hypothetical protein